VLWFKAITSNYQKMKNQIAIIVLLLYISVPNIFGQNENTNISIWVDGICGMCKDRIELAALDTRGVTTANWSIESKILKLTVDGRFKENRIHYKLTGVGHDTKQMKATDEAYAALHGCCKYRVEDVDGLVHELYIPKVLGKVIEADRQESSPLAGANIFWAGTTLGVISDENGMFEIEMSDESQELVASYVGYGRDTIHVEEAMAFEIEFNKALGLDEVRIIFRTASTSINLKNPFNIQVMHEKELLKAACCNLSESFETNPAVDVSSTDAVTGTRQIEMLGLAGPYVQITQENMPNIRGLAALSGLTYIPGPWINSIQLNTGAGSVVNGFESITGQINVELKKPENSERMYLNLFSNEGGRMEANLNLAHSINENLHTGFLLHGKYQPFKLDHNKDGFMDHPAGTNAIFINRWKYQGKNGLEGQFGIKGTFLTSESGQFDFDHSASISSQSFWGAGMDTKRMEAWMKVGKVFPSRPNSSIGLQLSGLTHLQDAFFGQRIYDASQQSLYSNIIYQGIIGNTNHQIKTGASFQYDTYTETLGTTNYLREEYVPGAFFEYTYNFPEQLTLVSGLRTDYHNNYGIFFTPRVHARYSPSENTVFRVMAGRGLRTANVIAENIGMLASSRAIIIEGSDNGNPYGLNPEVAWNSGISYAQEFGLGRKEAILKLDYYYTWFSNQIIANFDRSTDAVILQNLDGESFSGSFQAQLDYEVFLRYDVRLAYRFNDVRSSIDGELLPEALIPKHRAFLNMSYETLNQWRFNLTMNWQGMKRIPNTSLNPEAYQLETYSPSFFLFSGQLSKRINERFEIYLGAENILNYKQSNPIIDAQNPFGEYFDASLVWGPVFGRKMYGGFRYRIS
jgi:outer membrane receptor for ferrienterochelin and colicins